MLVAQPLVLGLLLGVRHALEPDHLAAITTLVGDAPSPRAAARTGAAWGLGHAIAIVAIGGVLVALGVKVPVALAVVLDVAVAIMLVTLGIWAMRARPHALASEPRRASSARAVQRSTLVGFVHGASGTAAITLICITTLTEASAALGFLFLFAVGSLLSMSAMSGLLAAPLAAVAKRGERSARALRYGGGVAAIAAAVFVVAGVVSGAP